jgi:hypothetical protein
MSAERAHQYYNRSPRYVLQFKDNAIVRFAAAAKGSKRFQTKILNLSETGMAFLLPFLDNPKKGEVIKVEFQVPSSEPIACFARVVRIEQHTLYTNDGRRQKFKLVAVKFKDLPVAQRQYIREGLGEEFEKIRKNHRREQWLFKAQWLSQKAFKGISSATKISKSLIGNIRKKFVKKNTAKKRYIDED